MLAGVQTGGTARLPFCDTNTLRCFCHKKAPRFLGILSPQSGELHASARVRYRVPQRAVGTAGGRPVRGSPRIPFRPVLPLQSATREKREERPRRRCGRSAVQDGGGLVKQKDCLVKARVTPEERAAVDAACAKLGCSVSEYVRCALAAYTLVYIAVDEPPELVALDATALGALYADVRHQGVNINQIAHTLNAVAAIADGTVPLGPDAARRAEEFLSEAAEMLPGIAEGIARTQLQAEKLARRRAVGIPSRRDAKSCP